MERTYHSILDDINNMCDSWPEVKTSTLTRVWNQVIPNHMENFFKRFKSSKEVTTGVVEIARELELEVEPAHVN